MIRAEGKFNGYIVEYIYDYYEKNGSYPSVSEIKERLNCFRDLIAYRIVISMPRCHMKQKQDRKKEEIRYLYRIANVLPQFLEERGFTAEPTGGVKRSNSLLLDDAVRPYYRDYIDGESTNSYRSLHITFFDNSARCYMEMQLRTKEMDDIAEIGADREHIHSHCIINSVNFETGKKVHMADEQIQELRVRNDQICEELGLPKFQRDEQKRSRGMSNAEYYTANRDESWKFELMRVIDECMRCAGSREEFLILLSSEGYDATWTDSRKNITYVTPDGRKCRDNKVHIEKYLKENMEAEFGYRTENDNTRNVDAAQKADGRGTTAGTQRDGHGAELERAARNAGQAVSAADAVERGSENAPDEAGSTERFDRDAGECRKIRETGWEPEREVFFRLQGADRDYEERPDHNPERYEEAAFEYGAGDAEENPDVRVDLDYSADLVRDAVRLGRAVEQMTDDAPTRDGTTMPLHIDSKRRKKLRQKKTALGHAEDDHEEMRMDTM